MWCLPLPRPYLSSHREKEDTQSRACGFRWLCMPLFSGGGLLKFSWVCWVSAPCSQQHPQYNNSSWLHDSSQRKAAMLSYAFTLSLSPSFFRCLTPQWVSAQVHMVRGGSWGSGLLYWGGRKGCCLTWNTSSGITSLQDSDTRSWG